MGTRRTSDFRVNSGYRYTGPEAPDGPREGGPQEHSVSMQTPEVYMRNSHRQPMGYGWTFGLSVNRGYRGTGLAVTAGAGGGRTGGKFGFDANCGNRLAELTASAGVRGPWTERTFGLRVHCGYRCSEHAVHPGAGRTRTRRTFGFHAKPGYRHAERASPVGDKGAWTGRTSGFRVNSGYRCADPGRGNRRTVRFRCHGWISTYGTRIVCQ